MCTKHTLQQINLDAYTSFIDFMFDGRHDRERRPGGYRGRYCRTPATMTKEETMLHQAVMANDVSQVRELLRNGVHPDCMKPTGTTPLSFASARGFYDIAKELIYHGADVNHAPYGSRYEGTPVFLASQYNRVNILELLCEKGVRIAF